MKNIWKSLALIIFIFFATPNLVSADQNEMSTINYSKDVIYQIVTDRFWDGDKNNNPPSDIYSADCQNLHKYCGGDWQGIIDKINDGYLTDLGITAIWISQPVENIHALHPNGYTSYHGYWAKDYKRTNPYYGDFSDFDLLINTAHQNNIKVIMDFTPNHSSPALESDPNYAENGAVFDDGSLLGSYSNDPENIFNHNGGTDFSSYEDSIYRNLYDLADYNLNSAKMDNYLKDSIKLWLDKGIDGIRVDAVKHMPQGWQKSLMNEIYTHKPVFTFGEWFLGKGEIDPKNHHFANDSGMSLLDFRYGQTIRSVLKDGTSNWHQFHEMIKQTKNNYNEVNDQVTFIDNHDMARFTSEKSSKTSTDIALAVLLTSRGVPTIYYGTEQYLTGDKDPENRKPMTKFDKTTKAYKVIQKLSNLRKTNPALGYGRTKQRWINSDVYIFERKFGNNVVITAVNKSDKTYTISNLKTSFPKGKYRDILNSNLAGVDLVVQDNGDADNFDIEPNSVSVWECTQKSESPLIGHVGPMEGQYGNTVTVSGEGFGKERGTLKIGDEKAKIISWDDSKIKFQIPKMSGGKYDISLKTSQKIESNTYQDFEVLNGKQVSIQFVVNDAYTRTGDNIYLTGNISELGNWKTEEAIGPMFNQVQYKYPKWYYEVSVPANKKIEFKFIKKDHTGTVIWESGKNHTYTTPKQGTDTIKVDWQE
ncbi:alpha-amylase family glycosyl hydrolase [Virgibacillus dokdonensis]|uniref:alpha-amylase family glycosyl hydrolase n=1 Tax=Virgibacillus dokdonensis TaxID=302167 RepID=UPI00098B92BA|nr:alpha-amylase family glycosyl hydrolase [Virgibacillus dokdonensis]